MYPLGKQEPLATDVDQLQEISPETGTAYRALRRPSAATAHSTQGSGTSTCWPASPRRATREESGSAAYGRHKQVPVSPT
jgi:hypothetical protein